MSSALLDPWRGDLRLVAVARGDRNAATVRAEQAFGEAGACITDVHFFSGVQTVLTFELPASRVRMFVGAIERAGLELDESSRARAEQAESASAEVEGTLAIVFADGDPDLRREVPAVPG